MHENDEIYNNYFIHYVGFYRHFNNPNIVKDFYFIWKNRVYVYDENKIKIQNNFFF